MSYSDNLKGAAPMSSEAQRKAWEQPGALQDRPMRGGFVGSTGLTEQGQADAARKRQFEQGRNDLMAVINNPNTTRTPRAQAIQGLAELYKTELGRAPGTEETPEQRLQREASVAAITGQYGLARESAKMNAPLAKAIQTYMPVADASTPGLGAVGGYTDAQQGWAMMAGQSIMDSFEGVPEASLIGALKTAANQVVGPQEAYQQLVAQSGGKKLDATSEEVQKDVAAIVQDRQAAALAELYKTLGIPMGTEQPEQ